MALSRDDQAVRSVAAMFARSEEWPYRSNTALAEFLLPHARLVRVRACFSTLVNRYNKCLW